MVSASPPMKALTNESSSGLFLQHNHNIAEGARPLCAIAMASYAREKG